MTDKMKVEIWSDVVCPFCYIGKREFEKALEAFPQKEQLDIEWKSYQLDPDMETRTDISIEQYLAEAKGIGIEDARKMNQSVTERARGLGLDYHFEKAIPANTMRAHCFIHFAKKHNKQDDAEELLFHSYFIEGKNIDDTATLLKIGRILELDETQLKPVLEDLTLYDDVRADTYEAFQLGVRGVPFFVFDRKYAISGAQPDIAFTQTLEKSFEEWNDTNNQPLIIEDGDSCSIDGECS